MSRLSFFNSILASRLYPLVFQILSGAMFALVLLYAFLGPPLGEDNFAVVVTWRLWWLLLPLSFFLFGRLWCGVCPVGAVSDLAQKAPAPKRRIAGDFLKKGGPWIMGSLFLGLFWIGMVRHICCWPRETAVVLLLMVGGAVTMSLAYHGRVWCRYLCPLGMFSGIYSMTGIVGLRPAKEVCRNDCRIDKRQVLQAEMKVCPLFELPTTLETNRNCNLCGNCVKSCQYGAMRLTLLHPGRELAQVKRPLTGEVFFALTLVAIAFVEAIQTTRLFPSYMQWALEKNILTSYDLVFSLSLLAVVALTMGSYLLATHLYTRLSDGGKPLNPASFAYSFLPLALAAYAGVSAFRLASHGARAIQVAINQLTFSLAPFDLPPPVRGSFYQVDLPVKALQLAILALGTLGALYVVARVAKRGGDMGALSRALPHGALVLLFSATFLYLFLLPAGVILH
ncbi:MAG: hypothetical protein HW388_1138 [Dehalococcoidia bacterium]|nr:hypothetical protein [Dehalococcoidia bacterium]